MIETIPMEIDSNFMQISLAFPLLFWAKLSKKLKICIWLIFKCTGNGWMCSKGNQCFGITEHMYARITPSAKIPKRSSEKSFSRIEDGFGWAVVTSSKIEWKNVISARIRRFLCVGRPTCLSPFSTVAAKRIKGNYEIFPRVKLCNQAHLSIYRYWTSIV